MRYILSRLLFVLCLTSCAQYRLQSISSTGYSPEAAGKVLAGSIGVGMERASAYEFKTEDLKSNITNTRVKAGGITSGVNMSLALGFELGVWDRIDLINMAPIDYAGSMLSIVGVKFQVFGETMQKASKGNNSVSVLLGKGGNKKEEDDSKFKDDENSNSNSYVNADRERFDYHLSYGHRHKDNQLVYLNLNISKESFDGNVVSDDSSIDGNSVSDEVLVRGISLGNIFYRDSKSILVEMNRRDFEFKKSDSQVFYGAQVKVSYHW